jgi:hypothetical protein
VILLFESNSLPDRHKYIYRQSSSKLLEKDIETAKEIEQKLKQVFDPRGVFN